MGIMGVVGNAKTGNAASGLGRYDAKRKNNWVMEFKGIGNDTLKNSLIIQLQKTSRPSLAVTEKEIRFANERWYVAGTPTLEPLEVTFYDALPSSGIDYTYNRAGNTSPHPDGNTQMVSAGQILWDWYVLMYDPSSGRIGLASDYKVLAFITLYNAWNTAVEKWMYIGVFPTKITYGDLDYSSDGDIMTVTATLRYDKVYRLASMTTQLEPQTIADMRGPEDSGQLGLTISG